MMLLFTRGSSSSGRFSGGSGPQAQVDPGGMGMVESRSTTTFRELQPARPSSQTMAMAATDTVRRFDVMARLLGAMARHGNDDGATTVAHAPAGEAARGVFSLAPTHGVPKGEIHERHRRSAVLPHCR